MQHPAEKTAFWQLQVCVFLWGFTAILGRLITLPATSLVLWRMGLAAALLALLPRVWRGMRRLNSRALRRHAFAGCVIALHWLAFYAAIKLANASVAVACLAVAPVFAAIIEPIVTQQAYRRSQLTLGLLAVPGVWLLIGGVPTNMQQGILAGIVAAVLTATFASINKRYSDPEAEPASITVLQLGVGALFLFFFGGWTFGKDAVIVVPDTTDLVWLLVLAVACTIVPFLLWLRALHYVSAFTTQLSLNLEPVYAITLAAFIFSEHAELTPRFYLGVVVILATVLLQPRIARD